MPPLFFQLYPHLIIATYSNKRKKYMRWEIRGIFSYINISYVNISYCCHLVISNSSLYYLYNHNNHKECILRTFQLKLNFHIQLHSDICDDFISFRRINKYSIIQIFKFLFNKTFLKFTSNCCMSWIGVNALMEVHEMIICQNTH